MPISPQLIELIDKTIQQYESVNANAWMNKDKDSHDLQVALSALQTLCHNHSKVYDDQTVLGYLSTSALRYSTDNPRFHDTIKLIIKEYGAVLPCKTLLDGLCIPIGKPEEIKLLEKTLFALDASNKAHAAIDELRVAQILTLTQENEKYFEQAVSAIEEKKLSDQKLQEAQAIIERNEQLQPLLEKLSHVIKPNDIVGPPKPDTFDKQATHVISTHPPMLTPIPPISHEVKPESSKVVSVDKGASLIKPSPPPLPPSRSAVNQNKSSKKNLSFIDELTNKIKEIEQNKSTTHVEEKKTL